VDALKKIKEVAATKNSDFDPQRFPNILRGPLERYILVCLKRDDDILVDGALEEVAKIIPYSAASIKKLLVKKIFPLLLESYGQVRPEILRTRIREQISNILLSEKSGGDPNSDVANDAGTSTVPETPTTTTANNKRSKKRKWTEDLKQFVHEYMKCASELSQVHRAIRANSDHSRPLPTSLSENALRRSAYRDLVACWPQDQWPMTSSELSRECSNWKKKYERALLKEHNVDIEQFAVIVDKQPNQPATEGEVVILVDGEQHNQSIKADDAAAEHVDPTSEPRNQ
jgi:hypothetical protein